MKNDVKSDPCENCIFEEGSRYCIKHCPYEYEVESKSCNCKDVVDCEYCDEEGFCQYSKLCISQRSVCNKFIDKQEPCDTCKHNDNEWDSEYCDGCCGNHSGYEPYDEWQNGYLQGVENTAKEFKYEIDRIRCEDVISREDARMCLTCEIKEGMTIEDYILMVDTRLKMLPIVQPICKEREKGECPWYAG